MVPEQRAQVLMDARLAEICKAIAKRKGYASLTGLINDALIALLEDDPDFELEFEADDVVAETLKEQRRTAARQDELADALEKAQTAHRERRKGERRTKKGTAAMYPEGEDRRKSGERRKA